MKESQTGAQSVTTYTVAYFDNDQITYVHAKSRKGMFSNARRLTEQGFAVDQMFATTRNANGDLIGTRVIDT